MQTVMLLNMHIAVVKLMQRLNFEKSLVAWSISEERVDQEQIINFVRPNNTTACEKINCKMPCSLMYIIEGIN